MKTKFLFVLTFFFLLSWAGRGQSGTPSVGSDATGSSGHISFSGGFTDYIAITGFSGSVSLGVQHPGIYVITDLPTKPIAINWKVYPNPSSQYVIIESTVLKPETYHYSLIDTKGLILKKEALNRTINHIPMDDHAAGVYLIKIMKDFESVADFKIIKL